jgi:hypothetical protein
MSRWTSTGCELKQERQRSGHRLASIIPRSSGAAVGKQGEVLAAVVVMGSLYRQLVAPQEG